MVYIVDWGVIRENFKERENGSPTMSRRAVDLEISGLGRLEFITSQRWHQRLA